MRIKLLILMLFSLVPMLFSSAGDASSSNSQTLIEDLVIQASNLEPEEGSGLAVDTSGLILRDSVDKGIYISKAIEAPIPFNALVPQWTVELPQSSGMNFQVRSGSSVDEWSPWQEIHPSADWTLPEDEQVVGEMSFVPPADKRHTFLQYKIILQRENGHTNPLLREFKLTFIDSTDGPTVDQLVGMQNVLDEEEAKDWAGNNGSLGSYEKPFVISRAVWCTDPRCNYSEGLSYTPVTHLILHHTAGSSGGDSAAILRAIWTFHAIGRGWGDIGYNFLVDIDGHIFEGHLGGDDVVGTHAAGANSGTMALSMIGTFTVNKPPAALQESIIDLFAWKADQRDIDVFDASDTLPYIEWGLPHIMGHRDVYGTTECPGGEAHKLIPTIRDGVAARLGLVSPHLYVDELSPAFTKSSTNLYTADSQCGYNTHAWYSWSTIDPAISANWGEWRPEVPFSGQYQIEAYIPYCRTLRSETAGASYTIKHADGDSSVVVSHQDNVGLWASLGEFKLEAGNDNVIRLTDLTTTDEDLGLWFDALRLLPIEVLPEAVTQTPVDGAWLGDRQVQFGWRIENPETVAKTTLQVATDVLFQNVIVTKEWPSAVQSVMHTFNQDYANLFWRVVLRSKSGRELPSASSLFAIDTIPPDSAVDSLIWLEWNRQYLVSWDSSDGLGRVDSYTIEYREQSGGPSPWQPWLRAVSSTSAYFKEPIPGQIYEFRSQAVDSAGNAEATHDTADIDTEQAISLSHDIILPLFSK